VSGAAATGKTGIGDGLERIAGELLEHARRLRAFGASGGCPHGDGREAYAKAKELDDAALLVGAVAGWTRCREEGEPR
jgi:hypothetical protein